MRRTWKRISETNSANLDPALQHSSSSKLHPERCLHDENERGHPKTFRRCGRGGGKNSRAWRQSCFRSISAFRRIEGARGQNRTTPANLGSLAANDEGTGNLLLRFPGAIWLQLSRVVAPERRRFG